MDILRLLYPNKIKIFDLHCLCTIYIIVLLKTHVSAGVSPTGAVGLRDKSILCALNEEYDSSIMQKFQSVMNIPAGEPLL